MKYWKCDNCKREKVSREEILTVVCLFGEYMEETMGEKKWKD